MATMNNEGLTFSEWCDAAGYDADNWNDCPTIRTAMLKAWRLGEDPSDHRVEPIVKSFDSEPDVE
jgi:hypothetical protein